MDVKKAQFFSIKAMVLQIIVCILFSVNVHPLHTQEDYLEANEKEEEKILASKVKKLSEDDRKAIYSKGRYFSEILINDLLNLLT